MGRSTKRAAPVEQGDPGGRPGYGPYIQTGTASWVDPFTSDQLDAWTRAALANSPYRDSKLEETSPLPAIEHVIYIVKENRTYDQMLGDMHEGNAPAPASLPPAGYLWTNAAAAGISIRNFGYMVDNKKDAPIGSEQIAVVRDPVLAKATNRMYRGFDLTYPDVERARVFLDELAEYEKSGNMPRLIVMRMGNDHTNGITAGRLAPLSLAADNDYAVGMLVEGRSEERDVG